MDIYFLIIFLKEFFYYKDEILYEKRKKIYVLYFKILRY